MTERTRGAAGAEWRAHGPLVLAAAAGMTLSAIATGSIGVIMGPLEAEFGWSRAEISSGPSLVSIVAMVLGTAVGLTIDRLGSRVVGIAAAVLICAALALMATVSDSLWHWWALWAIVGLAAAAMPTVWLTPVSSRFTAGRGLAMAVALSGTGITTSLAPIVANYFVENGGWRTAYVGMAGIWALVTLPLILLFFHGPAPAPKRAPGDAAQAPLPGLTAREGFRSPAFYKIVAAAFLSTVAGVGLILNLVPVFISTGIDRTEAAWIAGLLGVSTITGRLFSGWLMDRVNAAIIASCATVLAIVLPITLLVAPGSTTGAAIATVGYGLVGGAKIPSIAYLASKHLGPRAFGTLYGTINASVALSVAIGPFAANLVYDATKSYDLVMWAAVPLLAIAALLYASLGRYPDFAASRPTA